MTILSWGIENYPPYYKNKRKITLYHKMSICKLDCPIAVSASGER